VTRLLPLWRSLLYVPVHVEKFVASAHTRGADCIQLDLEDSVPPAEKVRARECVVAAARRVRQAGADVVVRINRPLQLAVRDIEASIDADVNGIAVTKVDSAGHLRLLDELVGELEVQRGLTVGHTRFIALIESAAAFLQMTSIARAVPRLVGMVLGGEDLAAETGMQASAETLLMPKQQMVLAAHAAGLMPLGFIDSVAGFTDDAAFRAMVRRSRNFGFMGASCVHPAQVPIVNEAYSPSPDDVARAHRIVDGYAASHAAGRGAFALDGRMIDAPVVEAARRLLARHAEIEARAAQRATYA